MVCTTIGAFLLAMMAMIEDAQSAWFHSAQGQSPVPPVFRQCCIFSPTTSWWAYPSQIQPGDIAQQDN